MVVVVGDGALQQTASELSKLLTLGRAPLIVVINNDGYTIERATHRPAAFYHDIPAWDWTLLPATVAPSSSTLAMRATSSSGLEQALAAARHNADAPVLVEAVLAPGDMPPLLAELAPPCRPAAGPPWMRTLRRTPPITAKARRLQVVRPRPF